jgi:uncharacterized protein (TIGR02145 family)
MKKVFTLFVIISLTHSVFAQSPQKMSYQAVVRNTSGVLMANQSVGMKISILQGSATGTAVYVETHTTTTNANGLATIEIGGGTVVTGTFAGIDWSNGTYFIKTETDPTGGTNYTVAGTSQILSVPYALHAKTAKTANYNDLTNKPLLFDGTWSSLTGKPSFATVATSGSYNDLLNRPTLFDGSWSSITAKPTTIAGYGITDAISTSHVANSITSTMITSWNTAYGWGNHSGLYKLNSYVPAWADITGKPTFAAVATGGTFADLLSKPTTLAGYGITNGMSTSHAANSITSTMITNWNTAFGWGNHAGLYRPVSYVPAWSEITSKPTTLSGFGITDAVNKSDNQTIYGVKTFKGTTPDMEQALFEVKNKDGQTIFAVYNEGVRIWVADGAKGTKGGFAVQGFDMKTDYMVIKPDSSNFYVREITPVFSSSFNIIGVKQNLVRKSLMFARTDTVGVSGVMNLQNNLLVKGNLNIAGTIYNKVTDVEGNSYNTITIGTQTWMAENLKTTKLNDGTNIALVTSSATWGTLSTPAYCWFNNDEASYKVTYGALYNWYTANTGKLCPSGWHIPNNTEWTTLTDYLGGQSIAGGKLKETGTAHWTTPNTGATDEVYFTGLPAGARGGAGDFNIIGNYGYWWTANAHSVDPEYAWGFVLAYNSIAVIRADYYYKRDGFSVRCVKN